MRMSSTSMVAAQTDLEARKEALWVISGLCAARPEQIAVVVDLGAVPMLVEMLDHPDDDGVTVAALQGLNCILTIEHDNRFDSGEERTPWRHQVQECGGLDRIENLRAHASEEVSTLAVRTALL